MGFGRRSSEQRYRNLGIKIFADSACREEMLEAYRSGVVQGFTTNPTLMRKAGIQDYERFAREILEEIPDLPISFEVCSDTFGEMEAQARMIGRWAKNVYVKIPVTNTRGESSLPLVRGLSREGILLNVTAVFTPAQVQELIEVLHPDVPAIVSVFAGRIADSGRDPVPIMKQCLDILKRRPRAELLWASPREVLNIVQAAACGCHIITLVNELLKKLSCLGKSLEEFSLETVRMFYHDASNAGYSIRLAEIEPWKLKGLPRSQSTPRGSKI